MAKEIVFTGSAVAIITPFGKEGVNYPELGRLIERQIEAGTDAIVVAGTTGEASTMPDDEHKEVIRYAVETVDGRVPVIAGAGSNDTAHAVMMSQFAESVGADALLLVTPYYNKCTQNGLVRHYTKIADSVSLPVILYNVPSRTGVNIGTETYVQLSRHPRIVATKEASGDLSAILKLRYACGDDLSVYSGNDDQTIPIMSIGGLGVISVTANVAPQVMHDMCAAYLDGDIDTAMDLQIDYCDLISAMFCEVNPIPVKSALKMMGFDVGSLRMPLSPIEAQHFRKVRQALVDHGLIENNIIEIN